ncbi:MAG: GNAT family N-acetyltransferase [Pseudodesulfovibrio sp.]|uniref:GNAT family N-acetyltransferase n=1 Tax=Pseudodesulfovibrio sp. TaxID=2035812 RepID=UPI003D0FF04F
MDFAIHQHDPDRPDRTPPVGETVRLHADYYGRRWGFDHRFEAQVSGELAAFMAGFDAARDGFWWAEINGAFAGAVAVDGSRSGPGRARLRWFIVREDAQGCGVGGALFAESLAFCRERGFGSVYLWTFAGLGAARKLYERNGFVLAEEAVGDGWGPEVTEQRFELEP